VLRNTNGGIDANWVIFAARIELIERHIARLAFANLFPDSHPCDAHPNASGALLAGLSLITHAGATLASQLAGSQLHAIGVPESVTSNSADYEAPARHLAHNDERATLRREQGKHVDRHGRLRLGFRGKHAACLVGVCGFKSVGTLRQIC
jgi:predicted O-linked N-acetylglucosamine transferase (SPINDLY family)